MSDLNGAVITGTVDSFANETKEHLVGRSGALLELTIPTPEAVPENHDGTHLTLGFYSEELVQANQPIDRAFDGIDCTLGFFSSGLMTGREIEGEYSPLGFYSSTIELKEPVVVDTTKPVVSNFSPAAGSTITKATKVSFDVTDDTGVFRRVLVVASFAGISAVELVHDGQSFRGPYANGSSRTIIDSGYHYILWRNGGWPGSPTIEVYAIDVSGNEAG